MDGTSTEKHPPNRIKHASKAVMLERCPPKKPSAPLGRLSLCLALLGKSERARQKAFALSQQLFLVASSSSVVV
jgi:hypothetical protein